MIVITGAAGFAGRHLVDRLAGTAPIVAWHRAAGVTGPALPNGSAVEWQAVDVLDPLAVRDAIARTAPTQVYHLAGSPYVGASWQNVLAPLHVNVLGTHHVLEAVRAAGRPCRVLVVSSAQIYEPAEEPLTESARLLPSSPYGVSKLAADQLALRAAAEDALDVVVARAFNHAGPGQSPEFAVSSFARQIALIEAGRTPREIKVGNLEARRDLSDVRDVVDAYVRLMTGGIAGRPYNVCAGRAWRMRDLLDELVRLANLEISVSVDPDRLRPQDTRVLQGDATRIRSELGWTPRIAIEQTLADTLDWWRGQV